MKTLYGLTKKDCKKLCESFDTPKMGLLLWSKGKAASIERGVYKAKKIKQFAEKL